MFNILIVLIGFISIIPASFLTASCCGGCCQSADFEIGWRKDHLNWKLSSLDSSYINGRVKDRIHFKNINSYTISGQWRWVGENYYVKLSADYGLTDKGRARQHFNLKSDELFFPIDIERSHPIKRRSEVYDFDAAVGYPFTFFCCRLSVIPLIGFSFHRQHLRVKTHKDCCSHSYSYDSYDSSDFSNCHHSSSDFFVKRRNDFRNIGFKNPFSEPDNHNIAWELGLLNCHRTETYRFTWYGVYLGADLAYAFTSYWTLFWNTEFHFLDRCNRKRKSWTGVFFVDDYHRKGGAYGFNNVFGFNYYMANCWYTTFSIDFDWWKSDLKNDDLQWSKFGAKIGLAYAF